MNKHTILKIYRLLTTQLQLLKIIKRRALKNLLDYGESLQLTFPPSCILFASIAKINTIIVSRSTCL